MCITTELEKMKDRRFVQIKNLRETVTYLALPWERWLWHYSSGRFGAFWRVVRLLRADKGARHACPYHLTRTIVNMCVISENHSERETE